jgi:hypothetical protein
MHARAAIFASPPYVASAYELFRREGCIFTFEAAALAPEKALARPAALDRSVTRDTRVRALARPDR